MEALVTEIDERERAKVLVAVLRDLGEGRTADGRAADVLELTFAGVGDTPQNKYHVWVPRDSGLVEQWAFCSTAADT